MRLRIIAYGVSVLLVLLTVSVVTFWLTRPRPYHLPDVSLFERVLAAPNPTLRQEWVDELLRDHDVAVSIYAPDGRLWVSNVEPPLVAEGFPQVAFGRGGRPPPFELDQPGPSAGPMPGHAIPLNGATPSIGALPLVGAVEVRSAPPAVLRLSGGTAVVLPLPREAGLGSFLGPLLVALVGLIGLSFPVTAAMTRRLEALSETARRFGEGDFQERASTANGTDELDRTAQAFNLMADRIVELRQRERVLLANVSHELRTPMARMAVLLELSQTKPEEAERYQRELGRDLRELEALLERITEIFRVELGAPGAREHQVAQRTLLDLRSIAEDVAADFRIGCPDRELSIHLPEEPVLRSVDEILVRRAVTNLLDNARKYSRGPLRLAVEPEGHLVVSDQGEGIRPEDLPHVFEPFFRADRSRNRSTGGIGLGLGFVQMVARLHDGDVVVETTPGVGSTFRIWLG
jgi:two-component system, OmpR family, sensor kinase